MSKEQKINSSEGTLKERKKMKRERRERVKSVHSFNAYD
jgi:hypothetical protein